MFRWSAHVLERIDQYGLTRAQVEDVIARPDASWPNNSRRHPPGTTYRKGDLTVHVAANGNILTVVPASDEIDPHAGAHERVYLEAWDPDRDVAAYEAIVCTPEVAEYLGDPDSDPTPLAPLLFHGDHFVSVTGAVWHDSDLVGAVWLSWFADDEAAEVTVAIRPGARGHGYGRGAVVEAAKLARSVRPGLAISGVVKAGNARSIAMVTRLGGALAPTDDDEYLRVTSGPPTLP